MKNVKGYVLRVQRQRMYYGYWFVWVRRWFFFRKMYEVKSTDDLKKIVGTKIEIDASHIVAH